MSTSMLVILSILGGIAAALQGQFMGILDQRIGSKESVFITYAGGGVLAVLMMMIARGGHLSAWQSAPWYAFTAGALGLVIVATFGYTVPRLGLTTALTVIVASQLVIAVLIDYFGLSKYSRIPPSSAGGMKTGSPKAKWFSGLLRNPKSLSLPRKRESRKAWKDWIPAGVYPGENRGRNDNMEIGFEF